MQDRIKKLEKIKEFVKNDSFKQAIQDKIDKLSKSNIIKK